MRLDEFESMFRSAVKPTFELSRVHLECVVLVTDLQGDAARAQVDALQAFMTHLDEGDHGAIVSLGPEDWTDVDTLLAHIERLNPQLIACQRQVTRAGPRLPFTLGAVVDVLTQATDIPVLLLPDDDPPVPPDRVMVVTDHLTGDDRLVSWALHLTPAQGHLHLVHVEEQAFFERYAEAISRIQFMNTERATAALRDKLLQLPSDYIQAVIRALSQSGATETVTADVHLGDPIAEYRRLISDRRVQLLIVNTKDPDQQAMEALSHALAVELRDLPLLLI